MRRLTRVVGLVLLALLVAGPGMAAQPTPVSFLLTYIPDIQFAPMYVALEKGYFADVGLDVTLEYVNENDAVLLLGAGARDYGMISGEQVLLARANEVPVTYVYGWFQQYPIALVATTDSGIVGPEDLAGQRIGLPGRFGASYTGLAALLGAAGLTVDDATLEEVGFNAPDVFCVGAVPAVVVYVNNEPQQILRRDQQDDCPGARDAGGFRVIPVGDFAALVSNGIVTGSARVENDPAQVAAFVAAFDQALADTIANPFEAYLLSAPYIETLPLGDDFRDALEAASAAQVERMANNATTRDEALAGRASAASDLVQAYADEAIALDVLMQTIALWQADPLGATTLEAWTQTHQTLRGLGLLNSDVALDGAFTNDFVPTPPAPDGERAA